MTADTEVVLSPGGDPPPDAAQAWAALSLTIGDLGKQLKAQAPRPRAQPIRGPRYVSGAVPASGPLVLDLGAPAMGRRWNLRNLGVSDAANVRTAAVGTADIYVGQPGAYGPGQWRWPFAALPAAEKFGAEQVVVIPADHLFVVVNGGTPGQLLAARAEVLDYPMDLPRTVQPV